MYYPYYLNGQTYGASAPTNPVQQPVPQQQVPQTFQNKNVFDWVQGEAGARGYMVPAGMTAWLMDSERQTFYIKSTDVSGIPQPLRIFDFSERNTGNQVSQLQKTEQSQYITREEFEERISSLLSSQQQRRDYEQSVQRTEQQSNGRTKQHGKHDANVQSV